MASFTDIVPQFNPFVEQLPIEAMVKVGTYKQQKYDEGIQKIQGYIDNIAGLDIMRNVDKEYLQSKLNELGNDLTKVAAGDFSNFQLVNSVSGMANQVIKDSNIQNAVSSTAWARKQMTAMDKAKSEGKSSVSNEWDFNDQLNSYVSSTDLKQSFKGTYTPYTDTKKKAMEAIKGLHPKLQSVDIPYVIDNNGKIDTKRIADAMTREKIEGVDEDQIKQAIYASMDPNDLNQLRIDGRYEFRGVTPEALVKRATTQFTQQREDAIATIDYLNKQKQIASDPNLIDKIDKRLQYYTDLVGVNGQNGKLYEALEDNIKNATNNPDEVKYSIYKDAFVKEFANAFSWKNQEKQLVENPLKKQENWVYEQREKVREFNINKALEEKRIKISESELEEKKIENALKRAELYGDPAAADWVTLTDPTTAKDQSEELYAKIVTGVDDKIQSGKQTLKDQGYTEEQINKMLKDYKENGNKATSVPAEAIGVLRGMLKNNNMIEQLKAKQEQLRKEADLEVRGDKQYKQELVNADNFVNSINGGNPVTLYGKWDPRTKTNPTKSVSPKEMINKISSGKAKFYIDAGQIIYDDGEIHVDMPRHAGGVDVVGGKDMRAVFNKVLEYKNKGYFDIQQRAIKKANDLYKQKLAPIALTYIPQIKAVTSGKDGAPPPIVISRLSALATSADFNNIAADDQTDLETTSEFLSDKYNKDTRVFIEQDGENYNVIIKNEQKPGKIQTLKLNKGEADVLRLFGQGYTNPRTTESVMIKAGKGNTNLTSDPENAIMQKQFGDLPRIRNLQVTADLKQDLSNPDEYIPIIYVKKKDGRYTTFKITGYDNLSRLGYEQAKKQINDLDDNTLLKVLKAQYPNYDFSNLDY